jgi:hypothetical protein
MDDEPKKGISITLSVYSGRENPQWWLTEGTEYKRLIRLIKALKIKEKPIFDYGKWNRLGYASFLIHPYDVEGLPLSIHVWRDMAYVINDTEGTEMYAQGAERIYDLLVSQAEERNQKSFFINYHKEKKRKGPDKHSIF